MSTTPGFRTDPDHPRPEFRGRTYAVPFDRVWTEAGRIVSRLRGWTLEDSDDQAGWIRARVEGFFPKSPAEITVRIGLDANGQTRVDLDSVPEKGSGGSGAARRRTKAFFRELDASVDSEGRFTLDARTALVAAALVVAMACSGDPAPEGSATVPAATDSAVAPATDPGPAERFERGFAFVSSRSDSVLSMIWVAESESRPTSVVRRARGSVHFAGNWQALHAAVDTAGPSPNPWRIVPDSTLRLIVGEGNGVEELFFRGQAPRAALELGGALNEWTSSGGGRFVLSESTFALGDRRETGRSIDLTRGWSEERGGTPGDWGLLVSGDSLTVFLAAPDARSETWQAWARRGVETYGWPEVTVTWGSVRAFDRARRDVPVSWTLSTPDEDVTGILELRSTDLVAGEGEGPLLPVDGFYDVAGTLTLGGVEIPVRGLIRHQQR